MQNLGFSTGALAKGELEQGIAIARELGLKVIELSALRLEELDNLVKLVEKHDFSDFNYVAIHAPTDFDASDEKELALLLSRIAQHRKWPVIVHPDTIRNVTYWQHWETWLCIENMDNRKDGGRTVEELIEIFRLLPNSLLCFDIGHARQVDSSMTEAYRILRVLRGRIRQIHLSEVSSDGKHRQVSLGAFRSFFEVSQNIPIDVPTILEAVLFECPNVLKEAAFEIERVTRFFTTPEINARSWRTTDHVKFQSHR